MMNIFSSKSKDERKALLEAAQRSIQELFNTRGWQIIEEDFKSQLSAAYEDLATTKPKDIVKVQDRFHLAMNTVKRIYELAGLEWTWDGYKDLREQMTEKISQEEILLKNYQDLVDKGDT